MGDLMQKSLFLWYFLIASSFFNCHGMEKYGALLATNFLNPCIAYYQAITAAHFLNQKVKEMERKDRLGKRPEHVQTTCDEAFENIKKETVWGLYNGSNYYTTLELDEDKLLEQLAQKSSKEKDIYIIDAGCARGEWGKNALEILQHEKYKKSGKQFHIFSVTGGIECPELVERKGHVTLYQFNQFKIENIDEEFAKRGFDLKNKVSLIYSLWTLRHLVDPFGTVKRMYSLLTPERGKLMANGFLFKFNKTDKIQAFPDGNENILIDSNATCLFREFTAGRDVGHFLLEKNDKNDLTIPLGYDGNTHTASWRSQNESRLVTVFNRRNLRKPKADRVYMNNNIYCDKDDQKCKDLYNSLLSQKLFYGNKI